VVILAALPCAQSVQWVADVTQTSHQFFFNSPAHGCPYSDALAELEQEMVHLLEEHGPACEDVLAADPEIDEWLQGMLVTNTMHAPYINYLQGFSRRFFEVLKLPQEFHGVFMEHVLNGSMRSSVFPKDPTQWWHLYAGYRHPRNLTGCEFMRSFEMQLLWNLDVCDVEVSKYVCAETCGCHQAISNADLYECPYSCRTT